MADTIRISRKRKELLAKYAEAAGTLYGVISIDELVAVFNHYEDEKTNADELRLGLVRLLKTERSKWNYEPYENLVVGADFLPEYEVDRHNIGVVRQMQEGKPRYLPIKEEFLRYVEFDYFEPLKAYDDLAAYIKRHKLTKRGDGLHGVEGDLIDLRKMIQNEDLNPTAVLDFFAERGYEFADIDAVNDFLQKLMDVHNNTRLFENNGFTPSEVFSDMRKLPPGTMMNPPFKETEEEVYAKVGRNDPCPCGSGLKYKKCHGSETPPQNKLCVSDTEDFYRLWYGVLAYVNKKYNLTPDIQRDLDRIKYKTIDASKIQRSRDKVWESPELIAEYAGSGAKLSAVDRDILAGWQGKHVKGKFLLLKHLKDYSVFMSFEDGEGSTLYGVIGLMNSVERLFPRERLPLMVDTVLLPFRGRIVHDSLIECYSMSFGAGAKEASEGWYAEQFDKAGITIAIE